MSFVLILAGALFWTFQALYSKILAFLLREPQRTISSMRNYILIESASSLARRIRNKKVTSKEVVESFIDRIIEINDVLNCVIHERFNDALKDAEKADNLINAGLKSPEELEREVPFLGVPFTVSATISAEGLLCTEGLWGKKGIVEVEDSQIVSLMRQAGAIPLASTNISEECLTVETNNPVFGKTYNPYDSKRSVGGSSGGEASLIASSGSPLGIGCDFKTSLRLSSAFVGIFSHTPTKNSCPLDDLRPQPPGIGPMSKSSEDLLPMLKILTKNCDSDLKLNEPVDVKKLKYYFMDNDGGSLFSSPVDNEIKEAIHKAIEHFRKTHKTTVKKVDLKQLKKAFFIWMAAENKKSKMSENEGKFKPCLELMKALCGQSRHSVIYILTSMIEARIQHFNHSNKNKLSENYSDLSKELQNLLGLDGVLIYPTQPTAAYLHNESFTKSFNLGYTGIFSSIGLPSTHCPMGLNSGGLPIGFQVVAGKNQDRLTIAVAREVDKVFGGWKPPPTHGEYTLKKAVLLKSDKNQKSL